MATKSGTLDAKDEVSRTLGRVIILQVVDGKYRAPVMTLHNSEIGSLYNCVIEKHLRQEYLLGAEKFWKIVRSDQNLETWRPRVQGTQLKALLNSRLPETDEEFEAVEATIAGIQHVLRTDSSPKQFSSDLRKFISSVELWWENRNKKAGGNTAASAAASGAAEAAGGSGGAQRPSGQQKRPNPAVPQRTIKKTVPSYGQTGDQGMGFHMSTSPLTAGGFAGGAGAAGLPLPGSRGGVVDNAAALYGLPYPSALPVAYNGEYNAGSLAPQDGSVLHRKEQADDGQYSNGQDVSMGPVPGGYDGHSHMHTSSLLQQQPVHQQTQQAVQQQQQQQQAAQSGKARGGLAGPSSLAGPGGSSANANSRQIVNLNVGGVRYSTSAATLLAVQGSFFWSLLHAPNQEDVLPKTAAGDFFIDRNGQIFSYVLEYLRSRASKDVSFPLPEDPKDLASLAREAEFFQLPGLLERVGSTAIVPQPHTRAVYDSLYLETGFNSIEGPSLKEMEARKVVVMQQMNHVLQQKSLDGFFVAACDCGVNHRDGPDGMQHNLYYHILLKKVIPTFPMPSGRVG